MRTTFAKMNLFLSMFSLTLVSIRFMLSNFSTLVVVLSWDFVKDGRICSLDL